MVAANYTATSLEFDAEIMGRLRISRFPFYRQRVGEWPQCAIREVFLVTSDGYCGVVSDPSGEICGTADSQRGLICSASVSVNAEREAVANRVET